MRRRLLIALPVLLIAGGLWARFVPSKDQRMYQSMAWDKLMSFSYEVTDSGAINGDVPAEITALNNRKIRISGFMVPTKMDGDKALSFLLAVDQQICCFGGTPPPNMWIMADVVDSHGTNLTMDVPVAVEGVLEVGATHDEAGKFQSLYRMRVDHVDLPEDYTSVKSIGDLQQRLRQRNGPGIAPGK